jgi:hypothetical protein
VYYFDELKNENYEKDFNNRADTPTEGNSGFSGVSHEKNNPEDKNVCKFEDDFKI